MFVKQYGIIGTAYSDLISLTVYNFIRFEFLRRKFGMQPFSIKTIYSLLLALAAYFTTFYLFSNMQGWAAIILRSTVFSVIMITGIFSMKLTPDAMQLYELVMKRLKARKWNMRIILTNILPHKTCFNNSINTDFAIVLKK